MAKGYGEEDICGSIRVLEELAGCEVKAGERESDLALGPRERPWRVRQVRASVVEKL